MIALLLLLTIASPSLINALEGKDKMACLSALADFMEKFDQCVWWKQHQFILNYIARDKSYPFTSTSRRLQKVIETAIIEAGKVKPFVPKHCIEMKCPELQVVQAKCPKKSGLGNLLIFLHKGFTYLGNQHPVSEKMRDKTFDLFREFAMKRGKRSHIVGSLKKAILRLNIVSFRKNKFFIINHLYDKIQF